MLNQVYSKAGQLMKRTIQTDKSTAQKIIDAAIILFAEKGYAAVSVKELAEAAGVNIASISYYFGGKENLYALALETQFEMVENIIDAIQAKDLSPIDKVRHFARSFAKMHCENPFVGLVYGEILNPTICLDTVVRRKVAASHSIIRGWVSDAIAKGELRSGLDPDCVAVSLHSLIHFYFCNKHLIKDFLPVGQEHDEQYVCKAVETYLLGALNPSYSSN